LLRATDCRDPAAADVFISYARADAGLAREFAKGLRACGFVTWMDTDDLRVGDDWVLRLEQESIRSKTVLAIVTPEWLGSDWTRFEVYGVHRRFLITPHGGEVSPQQLPPGLRSLQLSPVEPGNGAGWEELVDRLGEAVRTHRPRDHDADRRAKIVGQPVRTGLVVGREDLIRALDDGVWPGPSSNAPSPSIVALTGPGGVGKTTAACLYANLMWKAFWGGVYFVNGDDTSKGLRAAYAALAPHLGIASTESTEDTARAVRNEFERTQQDQRLLVFDNIDGDVLPVLTRELIPRTGSCHVLITARRRDWQHTKVTRIDVEALQPRAAAALLIRLSDKPDLARHPEDDRDVQEIARLLGGLPLALEQAGRVLAHPAISPGDYLALWNDIGERYQELNDRMPGADYPHSAVRSFMISFEKLTPESQAMLRIAACMQPEDIPVSLIRYGFPLLPLVLGRPTTIGSSPRKVLQELDAMAVADFGTDRFAIHRIPREVLHRDTEIRGLVEPVRAAWHAALAAAVSAPTRDGWYDRPAYALHLDHAGEGANEDPGFQRAAVFCAIHLAYYGLRPRLARRLRSVLARATGDSVALRHLLDGLLAWLRADYEGALGNLQAHLDHPQRPDGAELRIHALNLKAICLSDEGECRLALSAFQEALALAESALETNHDLIGILQNNLAWCHEDLDELREARVQYEKRLSNERTRRRPRPLNLGITHTNLATVLRRQGEIDEAARCICSAHHELRKERARPKKYLALALAELGAIRNARGQHRRGCRVLRRANRIQKTAVGKWTLDRATTLEHLATSRAALGHRERAVATVTIALAIRERNQSRKHPKVCHLERLHETLSTGTT